MVPRNSSQDQLTDNIVTIDIPLTEMSSPARKYTGSSQTMQSQDSGLSHGSVDMSGVRFESLKIRPDTYNSNNNNEEEDDAKDGFLFDFPLGDCLWDCYSFTRDICLSYYKWFLFILYNIYLILGIHRTWHKVSRHVRDMVND